MNIIPPRDSNSGSSTHPSMAALRPICRRPNQNNLIHLAPNQRNSMFLYAYNANSTHHLLPLPDSKACYHPLPMNTGYTLSTCRHTTPKRQPTTTVIKHPSHRWIPMISTPVTNWCVRPNATSHTDSIPLPTPCKNSNLPHHSTNWNLPSIDYKQLANRTQSTSKQIPDPRVLSLANQRMTGAHKTQHPTSLIVTVLLPAAKPFHLGATIDPITILLQLPITKTLIFSFFLDPQTLQSRMNHCRQNIRHLQRITAAASLYFSGPKQSSSSTGGISI